MKKVYESPVFLAEAYSFSSSIASCGYSANEPIYVKVGDRLCSQIHNGHKYGGQNGNQGNLVANGIMTVTLFNDGSGANPCQFDWSNNPNKVTGPDGTSFGTFADAFYGNESNPDKHAPGYNGAAFFS